MTTALIGYTGFVGTTLRKQTTFDQIYNSKNISEIRGKIFTTLVCAGAPAIKWKANQEPEKDLLNLQSLMDHLKTIQVQEIILISTVDVYRTPIDVDENTTIVPDEIDAYGKHRYQLELFVQENFDNHCIVRLPGLFGEGLKKNAIYDLMHDNCLDLIHNENVFQFYDMSRLWKDLELVRNNRLPVVNFSTEPVSIAEIARECFGIEFTNVTEKTPARYNMKSLYSEIFNPGHIYMMTKEQVYKGIRELIRLEISNQ